MPNCELQLNGEVRYRELIRHGRITTRDASSKIEFSCTANYCPRLFKGKLGHIGDRPSDVDRFKAAASGVYGNEKSKCEEELERREALN